MVRILEINGTSVNGVTTLGEKFFIDEAALSDSSSTLSPTGATQKRLNQTKVLRVLYSFKENKAMTARDFGQVQISINPSNGTVLSYNDELVDLNMGDT